MAAAQSGKTDIDYTALRLSYAKTDDYDPWGVNTQDLFDAAWKAIQAGDCATVMQKSDALLAKDFIRIPIHFMRQDCFDKAGDKIHAAQENAIVRGIADSLMKSGDGKSAETAYVVVSLKEEGFAMTVLGLKEKEQSLVAANGHMYDLLQGEDEKTAAMRSVFFRIDDVMMGEARMFPGPKKN